MKHLVLEQVNADLQKKMQTYGFTPERLGLFGEDTKRTRRTRSGAGGSPVAKYRHPTDPTLTWSGRGRPGRWLQELMDAGHPKEKFPPLP